MALLVNGFAREVLQELPMEFAVEAQKLVGIRSKGASDDATLAVVPILSGMLMRGSSPSAVTRRLGIRRATSGARRTADCSRCHSLARFA